MRGVIVMFVDEADIHVRAGDGGSGCIAFRREAHVPRGGPDGGDGGNGGSVVFLADASLGTLSEFAGRHHWRAESGRPGSGANRTGRSGRDLVVPVPVGTQVFDGELGLMLCDLAAPGVRVCVARGGRGGLGNAAFATPSRQAPRYAEPGTPGQERRLHLELKLIADVGLIGLPNAGKSTLLASVSAARPRIADYPFTTLEPQLGMLELVGERRLVLADLPGLIAGAHQGVGLGDAFLKHIERTRVLCHLLDAAPVDGSDPADNYRAIRRELELYSRALAAKPEVVVLTKLDLTGAAETADRVAGELGRPCLRISAVAGTGLRELGERMWQMVQADKQPAKAAT
ncbi:MAG: GTPase Obg [Phycisphaerae bacterium]|nr:GTPase Obg [Phycisphaerae bacterium]